MFLYASPKVWNSLALSLREIEILYLFKKHLKAYYLDLTFEDITITISIPIVDSFRYVGVILDNKLTFSDHISNVAKKVSRSVGIISKLRHYAPT